MANLEKCVTRCETSAFTRILGHLVPIEKFTGLQFPTNSQILERFFFIRDHSSRSKKHGQTKASSFYILLSSLGIEEETVVKKESLGIDAGNNNIEHV